MAPPLPTLSTAQFASTLGISTKGADSQTSANAALEALAHCPLKTIAQYDCVSRQYLVRRQAEQATQTAQNMQASQTTQTSRAPQAAPRTRASTRPDLICHEFLRYFRRCSDLPPGTTDIRANVEVTALMGIRRSASLTDDGAGV